MSDAELHELECNACPSAGSCGGQFTANTMACVSEAIGLALPGSAGTPAPFESRDGYAEASGEAVMNLLRLGLRPRDIVTRKALENAAMVVAASGGSTNAALHLPAIAHEAGIDFDIHAVGEVFKRTPYIGDFKPGGRYVMKDLHDVGGVPVLMKALLDGGYLHGDCITVTGRTIAENLRDIVVRAGPGRGAPDFGAARADRRPRRPQRQPRAAGQHLQGRGHAGHAAQVPRAGALLRPRGGLLRRGRGAPVQARRRARHPLRGTARRPRHARDALDHGGALRPGRQARRSRSSPMGASPAARAASASDMSGPRRPWAARSASCATAT